jgi:hypothetical protein
VTLAIKCRSCRCAIQAGRLIHYRQIKISVIGRKSGRTISTPVWFVLEGEKRYAG